MTQTPSYDSLRRDTSSPEPPPGEPRDPVEEKAEWGAAVKHEAPLYPALAVVGALVLYACLYFFGLRDSRPIGPLPVLIPILEIALLVPLVVARSSDAYRGHTLVRPLSISIIAVINVANLLSLIQLINALIAVSSNHLETHKLLLSSVDVWLTNVIVFALWYWELDRGGPIARRTTRHRQPDFLFPQMTAPYCTVEDWAPSFVDYFYVAFTNAAAFSPTDTMPLTGWAKVLMMVQSFASLSTVALVAARAVNILR